MGQKEADMICLGKLKKTMCEVDSMFRVIEGKALLPGHYYKGAEGVVIKVVARTKSGKTVYITTHTDDDAPFLQNKKVKVDSPFLQTKRVKIHDDGNEYICYKKGNYVIGTWNETDREAFRRYINANIGKPAAVI